MLAYIYCNMPSHSKKQQRFFQAVRHAKNDPSYGDERIRKVADSMGSKDIDDFAKQLAELRTKKALLGILKDIVEPMYLQEDEGKTGDTSVNPVTKTFHVNEEWAGYVKRYIGQPLLPKEVEALHNYKEQQPTTLNRTEVWYNTSDDFDGNKTTVIKKLKDGAQFSFTAFQKHEAIQDDSSQQSQSPDMGVPPLQELAPAPAATGVPPLTNPLNGAPATSPDPSQQQNQQQQKKKDDIIVTKSILFKDEVSGAGILISFLKKLDL